jgi:hypothetical protein
MRHFNRKNCTGLFRDSFIDIHGRTITLGGIHAFEYFIEIRRTVFTEVKIELFYYPNGRIARQRFQQLKRKR